MASEPIEAQPAPSPEKAANAQEAADAIYGGSYFAANHVATRKRSPISQDIDVDICVIGAGLAGLTVARELARKSWTVAVLEAKRIAWNASGRNTGFVLPGFAQDAQTIVDRVGLDAARELWGLSLSGLDYMRSAIADGQMQGMKQKDMEQSEGWLHVSNTDRTRAMRDETELLRNLGADVEFWPETLVRAKLKCENYFQAVHFPTAFSIHPLNYALGLAELAEQAGARIFENSAAISIDPAGVRKRILTATGRVRASHIVLAGNTHMGKLTPQLSKTLIPMHTYAIVTKPLGPELAEAIDYPGSVSDTERADNHYRIIGGDRLMWSGRMTVWDAKPGRLGRRLKRDLSRRFPQLQNAEVDYAWTGELGLAVHRMPQIGEISPGVWLASGFAGHGLNTTAMAGQLIASAVAEGDDRWRQFQPFELVWAGGRTGRIILQGAYWGRRQYDKWASKRARAQELHRIRMEPILKKRAEEAQERARLYAEWQEREELARAERLRVARELRAAKLAEKARLAAERAEARRIRAEQRAEERRIRDEQRAIERAEEAERQRILDEQRAIERAEQAERQRILDEQRAVERAEAARVKALQDAENARIRAEERAEAARIKAEQKAARKAEKERLAAEKAEAKRLEAERRAAEKAAAEAARIEAARIAAEQAAIAAAAAEAARIEAERIAAEQAVIDAAAAEAARLEAERVAAERAVADEAARIEAQRVAEEQTAAAEAERLQAERMAAEIAAAEAEAARIARVEAERITAEEEAATADEAIKAHARRIAAEEVSRQLQRSEEDKGAVAQAHMGASEAPKPDRPPAGQPGAGKGRKKKRRR